MGKTKHSGPVRLSNKPQPGLWVSGVPFAAGGCKRGAVQ